MSERLQIVIITLPFLILVNVAIAVINHYQKKIDENHKLKEWKHDANVIDEFIKNVLTELNGIAEDDDYTFSKDNADLVSSVLYGQQFVMEKERKQ